MSATRLERSGAPRGSGEWTHQYADAGNSVVSRDDLVRAPLGLLWFGGPTNDDVLPRHGHGPTPQVVAGRLLIEGPNMLRAMDIYTGRLLWQREFKALGQYYDHTTHQPGAAEIGSNYVSQADWVYVIRGNEIVALDAASGEPLKRFVLKPDPHPRPQPETAAVPSLGAGACRPGPSGPTRPGSDVPPTTPDEPAATAVAKAAAKPSPPAEVPHQADALQPESWTFLAVWKNYLVATAGPAAHEAASPRLIVLEPALGHGALGAESHVRLPAQCHCPGV